MDIPKTAGEDRITAAYEARVRKRGATAETSDGCLSAIPLRRCTTRRAWGDRTFGLNPSRSVCDIEGSGIAPFSPVLTGGAVPS